MKKVLLLVTIVTCVMFVGCGKAKEEKKEVKTETNTKSNHSNENVYNEEDDYVSILFKAFEYEVDEKWKYNEDKYFSLSAYRCTYDGTPCVAVEFTDKETLEDHEIYYFKEDILEIMGEEL